MALRCSFNLQIASVILALAGCSRPVAPPDARLILAVRNIADAGLLGDPGFIAASLGTVLLPSSTAVRTRGRCSDGRAPDYPVESKRVTYRPSSGFWFTRRAEGEAVDVPSLFLHVARSGAPDFSYEVEDQKVCYPPRIEPGPTVSAVLEFSNVSGYACITGDRLKAILPRVRFVAATDGAMSYQYTGSVTSRSGVLVTFDYVFGQKCLLDIRAEENQRYSKRFIAARLKLQSCERRVDAAFPDADDVGRRMMDRLKAEQTTCGAYWDYLPGGSRH